MKIVSDGWIYDIPENAEFIEVTSMDRERAFVQCFDAEGELMDRLIGDVVSTVAPVESWAKRLVRIEDNDG